MGDTPKKPLITEKMICDALSDLPNRHAVVTGPEGPVGIVGSLSMGSSSLPRGGPPSEVGANPMTKRHRVVLRVRGNGETKLFAPCPFCGSSQVDVLARSAVFIQCRKCLAEGPYDLEQNEDSARLRWNDRFPILVHIVTVVDRNAVTDQFVSGDADRAIRVRDRWQEKYGGEYVSLFTMYVESP